MVLGLVLVGLLTQGLHVGTAPGSLLLCVGCEDSGWTVIASDAGSQAEDCCADVPVSLTEPSDPSHDGHAARGCVCICVPLGGGPLAPSWLPRLGHGDPTAAPPAAIATTPNLRVDAVALSGPPTALLPPSWGLDPRARRTVLVL